MRSRREDPILAEQRRLQARIAELEDRMMLLEARMRRTTAEVKSQLTGQKVPVERPRPRCPGCLLELPKGKRGKTCVWCGFDFAAAPPRILGARTQKGR